ncbi:hypothetical protein GBAR_LOCUS25565 [Geodia barretti]|uniref:Uncharacterized protein n=1 Tax=Geodia barretti TaxID=519541 RepID=A0AA35TE20_GEOBA|nr:hypothetical protein GBAR_LOCUS25565 [Geodia barretti]
MPIESLESQILCDGKAFVFLAAYKRAKPKAAVCGEATGWEDRQWKRVHITHTETAREIDLVDNNNINAPLF